MFTYKKFGGFTYNIIENQEDIKPFLLKWIGKEWRQDMAEFPDQSWSVEWMDLLLGMNFYLVKLDINKIMLRPELMTYKNDSYNFVEELQGRAEEMEESILRGSSIEPLLVNGKNMELMDGYTRYTILKKHNEENIYVYLGKKTD